MQLREKWLSTLTLTAGHASTDGLGCRKGWSLGWSYTRLGRGGEGSKRIFHSGASLIAENIELVRKLLEHDFFSLHVK